MKTENEQLKAQKKFVDGQLRELTSLRRQKKWQSDGEAQVS